MDFSSWPRDQEQTFVVYEQRTQETAKKAFMVGLISGLAVLVVAVGIAKGVEPDKRDMTKGMNMDNLTKKSRKSSQAPAEPAPTPAPKAEAPAPPAEPAAGDKPAEPAAAPAEEKK
jgi:hypothetical protein